MKKYKEPVRAIDLIPGDWIKIGGVLYKVASKAKHTQSVEINCEIDSHPYNNFTMYLPDHMPFNVYYRDIKLKDSEMPKPNIVYDSAVMLCAANALCQPDDGCWPLCHPKPEEE